MDLFIVRRRAGAVLGAILAALVVPALTAGPAAAHETREVGDYTFVVGWYDEPAFANQPNGPEVTITRGPKETPIVESVDLQVDVTFGGETVTYPLEPAFVAGVFGDPGNYSADLFPTRPGTWEFRIYGTVVGQEVDETFTSGEETFSDIEDPAEIAFPVADPNNQQLASRLEEEADEAGSARVFGVIGVVLGAVALIIAGMVLLRRRG
ncbi:MAG TPA: hypothetical protein VG602_08615 [Actinomycetota bacterium]|nr:hypothetical protein [Actinomycetota bacterium]